MKIKLIDRIRGAIRGFKDPKSKQIGGVTFGFDIKQCVKRDLKWGLGSVYYLCDGKKPECACDLKDEFCGMTTDISHARNFKDVGKSMDPVGSSIWVEIDEEDREEDNNGNV